jgi:hypothetical protein
MSKHFVSYFVPLLPMSNGSELVNERNRADSFFLGANYAVEAQFSWLRLGEVMPGGGGFMPKCNVI